MRAGHWCPQAARLQSHLHTSGLLVIQLAASPQAGGGRHRWRASQPCLFWRWHWRHQVWIEACVHCKPWQASSRSRPAASTLAAARRLAAAAAPAAPCQAVDETAGSSTNGCIRCSADNTRCELCTDSWVLTAEGQCARVSEHCTSAMPSALLISRAQCCNITQPPLLPLMCSATPRTSTAGRSRARPAGQTIPPFV